jgi:hypothetical protein
MADIIEVILADHKRIRRMLGALDDAASYGEDPCAGWMLAPVWCRLADLLELHAEAEEDLLSGPVRAGQAATAQMQDAIADHDDCREEVREAGLHAAGSALWWRAVASALWASSDHVAREQRGALAAFGRRAAPALRNELCRQWAAFIAARTRDATPETRIRDRLAGRARPGATRDRALYYAPGRSCCSC